jgi:DNA-binding GntR family transcriptional regulator
LARRGDGGRGRGRPAVLRSSIFFQLRDDILKGRFKQGESLVELKLAARYGVSRTPVREALRQLELEGLVKYLPNRGVLVEGITAQDVEDIFLIREHLEALTAEWAAQRVRPEEVKKMKEIIDLQEFYAHKDDIEQLTVLDTEFHRLLLDASRSKSLRYALGGMLDYVEQARSRSLHVPGRIRNSVQEHKQILAAVAAGDAGLARERMAEHMRCARQNVLAFSAQQGEREESD